MQRLTQSKPDNCWQTCVAMLLGCSADVLPDQSSFRDRQRYADVLRVYLFKHHDLTYVEVEEEKFEHMAWFARNGHVMIGETVRTTEENDTWHAVVGVAGKFEWDVHPSRDGLVRVRKWGLLVPVPADWRAGLDNRACACHSCGSDVSVSV